MISSPKTTNKIFEEISLCPAPKVYEWGTTLVVAPQPEDESLGCGGAIALLRSMGYRVHVLYFTHGNLGKTEEPLVTDSLFRKIKEEEAVNALEKLGMTKESATFLHLRDRLVPEKGEPGFEEAVRLCMNELESFMPETVLMPCRFHTYDDHYASWQIMQEAIRQMIYQINTIEYMVWKGAKGNQEILSTNALKPWRLDIKPVIEQKIKAVAEHRTQKDDLINWNRNSGQNIEKLHFGFAQPWETYFEPINE